MAPTEPCALGSTQPLKMSTKDFSGGKGGRCVRLTIFVVSNVTKIRGLNLPGTVGATSACCGMTFTFTFSPNVSWIIYFDAGKRSVSVSYNFIICDALVTKSDFFFQNAGKVGVSFFGAKMKYIVPKHNISFKGTELIYWRVTLKIIPAQIMKRDEEK